MYFCCCSKLVAFSGKLSKAVTGADRPKMAEISAPSNDTRTSLVKSAEGSTVFSILGDPGAVSRVAGIFVGESLTWAIATVEWAFQREDSRQDFQKKIKRSPGNRKL